MVEEKLKDIIAAFTADGDFLAILSAATTLKIWNTNSGSLLAEWRPRDGEFDKGFSCLACSFVGKKRRKERGTCLVALATDDGHVFAVDVFSGDTKWKNTDAFPGGVSGLYFTNKGRNLHVVGTNRMVHNMNLENGDLVGEFKASKKPITALAFSSDEKFLAVADGRLRVLSLENGKEVLKFSSDLDHIERASLSDDANTIVTLGSGDKHLQVWKLDKNNGTSSRGPSLPMKHSPLSFQCKDGRSGESGSAVLAVLKSGAYVWHLRPHLAEEEEVSLTRITCKVNEDKAALNNSGSVKKSRVSIIAARLHDLDSSNQIRALIAYGSIDQPWFTLVDISNPGEDFVINALEETKSIPENEIIGKELNDQATVKKSKKATKKRSASDLDQTTSGDLVDTGNGEAADGVLVDDDLNEPTMGDKLADLNLVDSPPSADSVHVLLKQALHADDRVLLLDCLYTQDEKVISKSISQLNPSHVLKLLQSLMSIIQSRGAILACARPWLKCLLLQHSSGIMSQQSSLVALNSLYQLIESRVSTFQSALQLSSVLDVLYTGIVDDEDGESGAIAPVIFEDKDSSDEDDDGADDDAMETDDEDDYDDKDNDGGDVAAEALGGLSDLEGSEGMSE